jgi:hypothetical protein
MSASDFRPARWCHKYWSATTRGAIPRTTSRLLWEFKFNPTAKQSCRLIISLGTRLVQNLGTAPPSTDCQPARLLEHPDLPRAARTAQAIL